jgi:2-hydroxychromene-2-carboxylate isomerase
MRKMPEPVRFYFDFISPYAYLAFTQIHAVASRAGREVELTPILFAALLDANGTIGPAEVPTKRIYVFKDTLRSAHALGVAFAPPPAHPFNPLLALRVASIDMPEEDRRRLVGALYTAVWGGGPGVVEEANVARVANDAGFDGEALVRAAGTPEIKQRVRTRTDEAIALGVFGVPTTRVDGELFWGLDSLAHAERRMRGEDPVTPELLAGFRDVPAQSVRARMRKPE